MVCKKAAADYTEKGIELWDLYGGYLRLLSVQDQFGVIRCTYLKIVCNSTMPDRRVKRINIWDSRILVGHIHVWRTLDLVVFNVIVKLFSAFVSKWAACNSKTAGRRAKRIEIYDVGTPVEHIWGVFDLIGFTVNYQGQPYTHR